MQLVKVLAKLPDPGGGKIASRTPCGVRFHTFITMAFNSRLHSSIGPSILMRNEVRINAKSVAVNVTVPSAFNGMFMATNRWNHMWKLAIFRNFKDRPESTKITQNFLYFQSKFSYLWHWMQSQLGVLGFPWEAAQVAAKELILAEKQISYARSSRKAFYSPLSTTVTAIIGYRFSIMPISKQLPCMPRDEGRVYRIPAAGWFFCKA